MGLRDMQSLVVLEMFSYVVRPITLNYQKIHGAFLGLQPIYLLSLRNREKPVSRNESSVLPKNPLSVTKKRNLRNLLHQSCLKPRRMNEFTFCILCGLNLQEKCIFEQTTRKILIRGDLKYVKMSKLLKFELLNLRHFLSGRWLLSLSGSV